MESTVNLRIEVPANLENLLKERAHQAGVPVESFVLQSVTERLAESEPTIVATNTEDFNLWLRKWADRFPKLEHPVDDSRESIYAGRGE
ncbi:MAG: hypothetical protein ACK57G_13080 [Planctomycetota bacterium]